MLTSLVFAYVSLTGADQASLRHIEAQVNRLVVHADKAKDTQQDILARLAALEKEQESRNASINKFYKNLWEPLISRVNTNSDKIEEINKLISKQTTELALIGAAGSVVIGILASFLTVLINNKILNKEKK